jgi:hypothetical protein
LSGLPCLKLPLTQCSEALPTEGIAVDNERIGFAMVCQAAFATTAEFSVDGVSKPWRQSAARCAWNSEVAI